MRRRGSMASIWRDTHQHRLMGRVQSAAILDSIFEALVHIRMPLDDTELPSRRILDQFHLKGRLELKGARRSLRKGYAQPASADGVVGTHAWDDTRLAGHFHSGSLDDQTHKQSANLH
jgi:hypothetical protein